MNELSYRSRPYTLNRNTAPAFWLVATLWLPMATAQQTGNQFSFIEQLMPSGLGPPTHRHPNAEEGFYVLDGVCSFNADGETLRAGPGTLIHLPRMLPHSFSVDTTEARVLNFYAPAGFELIVMSIARLADARVRPELRDSAPGSVEQVRILSRLFGQEAVTALPFCQTSTVPLMKTEPGPSTIGPLHTSNAEVAPRFEAFGFDWRLLAGSSQTGGGYDLFEVRAPAGGGLPDRGVAYSEAIYVLEGDLTISLDGNVSTVAEGTFAWAPAGSAYAWRAGTAGAKLLVFHLPSGCDEAISEEAGDDNRVRARLIAARARFLPPTLDAASANI